MTKFRAIILRRWALLLVTTVVGLVGGYVSASVGEAKSAPSYVAQQIIVSNREVTATAGLVGQDYLKVTRGDVAAAAAKKLGVTDVGRLTDLIVVTPDPNSSSIKVSTKDKNPEAAAKRADAFVSSFLDIVNKQLQSDEQRILGEYRKRAEKSQADLAAFDALHPELRADAPPATDLVTQQLVANRKELSDLSVQQTQALNDAALRYNLKEPYSTLGPEVPKIEDTLLPTVPTSPLFRAGLLGLLGLLLGSVLVMVVERVNQRIDTRDELAEILPIPILAEIGHLSRKRRTFHSDGRVRLDGIWAEHYRRIRSAIQFVQSRDTGELSGPARHAASSNGSSNGASNGSSNGSNGHTQLAEHITQAAMSSPVTIPNRHTGSHVFLFTSTLPGEGKSTSAALTSLALSEVGIPTLAINADFRKPRIDALLGAASSPTLADRARLDIERPSIDEIVQPSDVPNLWLVASGAPTYEVGGRLEAAREVAEEAARRGATVIIDSTPLRVANDPIDLMPVVDQVILVIRSGRTTRRSLLDTLELLEMHHAPLMGAILIGTLGSRELYAYYDSYYSRVRSAESEPGEEMAPPPAGPVSEPVPSA